MKSTRPYVMRARADATEQTRQRIMRATIDLARDTMSMDIALAAVAERAGVSVQTLLRHFGNKDGLLDAVQAFAESEVIEERAAPAGDVEAAVRVLLDHYERAGDWTVAMLAQERLNPYARRISDRGRPLHRRWVETVFAPQIEAHPAGRREALTDLLVVATDVYTWKLLRRDRQLDLHELQSRFVYLIAALVRPEET